MIYGGELRVLEDSSAVVALSKSCTIKYQCKVIEVSPPNGGTAEEYVPGRTGWTVEVSGLMSAISNLMLLRQTYALEIYDGSNSVYGNAICTSVQQVGTIGNLAQQSCVFQGTGPLSETAPSSQSE